MRIIWKRLEESRRVIWSPALKRFLLMVKMRAMCHYISTRETDTEIQKEGFYLVDAGGQYRAGTTDITRTVVMGTVTEEQKLHYTLVLKGMIDLAKARFHQGTNGQMLDYLARGPDCLSMDWTLIMVPDMG